MVEQRFSFWLPASVQKAINPETGEEIMRLGGIASTIDKDSDGEELDPAGFDIQPLLTSGTVNWHHQTKGMPTAIIGEPTKAEIRKDGLYIETDLYPSSQVAQDVWKLANTFEKDSKTRHLGYSIEGKVLKRKSENKKSPDYNRILKAAITGVAITHMPKNSKTFANIIKGDIGEINEDDIFEEALEAGQITGRETTDSTDASGASLKTEELDKTIKNQEFASETDNGGKTENIDDKKLTKSDVIVRVMEDYSFITIEKANKLFNLINKISVMDKKQFITDEDIAKAYDLLGLDNIEKGGEKKSDGRGRSKTGEGKANSDGSVVEDMPNDEEDDFVDTPPQGGRKTKKSETTDDFEKRFDRLEKALVNSHASIEKYIKASATLVKAVSDQLNESKEREENLLELVKGQEDIIFDLRNTISEFGEGTPPPKSMRASNPIDRIFAKANDNELDDNDEDLNKAVSMSKNKNVVAELLDQATFAKGFDNELSQACTGFDVTGRLSPAIIARMRNEFNVNIVK